MYELNMRRYELLQEWNAICDFEAPDMKVQELSFKLSKNARNKGHDGSLTNHVSSPERPPVPLTEEERGAVSAQVSLIHDVRLRRHAEDAMISILEWKKSKPSE